MSMITKPVILDETGRQIASILEGIRDAISAKSVNVPNMPGVKFIDYDGTVVYFAGREEVLHMKKLPDAPAHVDLTAQGWNWSLADIKAYMTKYPDAVMTVGQMYIPSDGKTHMILDVGVRKTIPLMIQQTVSNGVTINWGDGSEEETIEGTGVVTTSHTYEAEGEYEITLDVTDGCTLEFGGTVNDTAFNVFYEATVTIYANSIKRLFIGNGVTGIGKQSFYRAQNLTILSLPDNILSIEEYAFYFTGALTTIIIPNKVVDIKSAVFYGCTALNNLSMPNDILNIADYAFGSNYTINNLTIPDSVTSIGQRAFDSCNNLINLTIPNNVTSIGQRAFDKCYALINLTIPDGVNSIAAQTFGSCFSLYNLTILAETPPTLADVNAFSGMPFDCTIYVPHGKGDVYKADSKWSTWASRIQELPE